MGTQPIFKLAVGICIIGAVSAQYHQNSVYRGEEKEHGSFRPYFPSSPYSQQQRPTTTPAPEDKAKFAKIMKQINKVNDDGSYTFGFENDDGSFRVETRSKDGLVKGKYGFIDANGQLKVTEYTAGEKSDEPERDETNESEEDGGDFRRPAGPASRPLPLSARPQPPTSQPRPYYSQPQSLASRSAPYSVSPYRVGARAHSFDQAPAAQTTNSKVSRAPPTSEADFNESSEDEPNNFANRQSGASQEDPLNNQYFRQSVTPSGASSAGGRGRFPAGGISAAGRPIGPYATGAPGAYAQQYPGGFSPAQYNGFQGGPGGPQGFPQGGPQGFPGAGAPQFGGPGQFIGSPQDFRGAGGFPQGTPQGFRRQAPQDFSSIGSPQAGASPQGQSRPIQPSIQNFGGFGGFNARQGAGKEQDGSNNQVSADENYVPSVELDGYSEDLDEDGYPDEPPKDGKLKSGASGASSPNFRGAQGVLQGGVQPGAPQRGSPQVILQIGPQGQVLGGPTAVGGGRFPGGQQGPTGIQGGSIPQYYSPQQGFGGFPQGGGQGFPQGAQGFPQGAAQGFPQGFPQGFEGQGGFQGFPQQYPQQGVGVGVGGRGAQFQGGPTGPTGSPIQSEGFPYDFSPFGGAQGGPQGFPASGPQGFPIQQGSFPASGEGSVQNFGGFPGSAGGPQGFPVGAGRFAGGSGPQGSPGGAQSFVGGGVYPGGLGGQASPSSGGGAQSSSSEQKKA